ncbi:hypothetical protein M409DRAFT_61551 [Zasmidium cellare ATCC 36951]|uniref:Uncharacterized protein n=1 Tax=Zasmidium cellare ATCC 36951 TaxID=1080233 RepID=A0A6A6BYD4_ZASCE|nr:uncharacterized protein M409DRAFT_61551 [Zasmidium cellare ATCC 36951]KAF2158539.1 hypothetical protein M409DRAFT_61551 [Zasmidium cellare ATCC 36951]
MKEFAAQCMPGLAIDLLCTRLSGLSQYMRATGACHGVILHPYDLVSLLLRQTIASQHATHPARNGQALDAASSPAETTGGCPIQVWPVECCGATPIGRTKTRVVGVGVLHLGGKNNSPRKLTPPAEEQQKHTLSLWISNNSESPTDII